MIRYDCPRCGSPMASPDSMAGQSDKCPECANLVPVPPVDSVPAVAAPSAAAKPQELPVRPEAASAVVTRPTATESLIAVTGYLAMLPPLIFILVGCITVMVGKVAWLGFLLVAAGIMALLFVPFIFAIGQQLKYLRRIEASLRSQGSASFRAW